MNVSSIAVLGAGGWGTALAAHLGQIGHPVRLWGRDAALLEEIAARRANPTYLPDITFPPGVVPTPDLGYALETAHHVVIAVPSHGLRAVVHEAVRYAEPNAVLISAAKGLETKSLLRMSEVIREEVGPGHPIVALSGPSFAAEVARGLPTAVVVASTDPDARLSVQKEFRGPNFRLYGSADVVGVELGGALKNVIAIASGVVDALQLGFNARSALITRGLVEMSRLVCAMGGERDTLAGLSGLGDLVLTCTGELSRNRHVGMELGRGRSLTDILAGMRTVAEGVRTTEAALALAARHGVELPIAAQMAEVLAARKTPKDAVADLMLRPQRGEGDNGVRP
jgi:glycerol-3-phosphate dehydrogenase (NAD(P)+)